MSKKKIALLINTLILILELIAIGGSLLKDHFIALEYYTNDSNIIALFSSLLFIIFYKKDLKIVKDLRLLATSLLTVTFIVVITILVPMYNFNYKLLMFTDNFLILHTICPILCIISYVFFEKTSDKIYLCPILTIVYSIILVLMNIFKLVDGPYPFLKVNTQSIIVSLLWGILIIGGRYFISSLLNYINKKIQGAKN